MLHQLIAYGDLNGKLSRKVTRKENPGISQIALNAIIKAARQAIKVYGSIRALAKKIGETFSKGEIEENAFSAGFARSIQIRLPKPDTS